MIPPPPPQPSGLFAPRWRLALLLALIALASAVLLSGTSVWFLGAVALAGAGPLASTFNFHHPAALVRLFALTRTVAKYGERITGHRAALADQIDRRSHLFARMAGADAVRSAGWQLSRQERLADYMDDVENADFARLRVGFPVCGLLVAASALALLTLWFVPWALVPTAAVAGAVLLGLKRIWPHTLADEGFIRAAHRRAAAGLGSALSSVVPLQAEGAWPAALAGAFRHHAAANDRQVRQRGSLAMADLLLGWAGPAAALAVLLAGWQTGLRDTALLPAAFVAFGWLALGEAAQALSRVLLGAVRAKEAETALAAWGSARAEHESPRPNGNAPVHMLALENVARCAPDGRPLGGTLNLAVGRGRPLLITGPSGSGKTTLLKQIAGWIDTGQGTFAFDGAGTSPADRSALCHLGLHDAAILADTVRENLFAASLGQRTSAVLSATTAVTTGTAGLPLPSGEGWGEGLRSIERSAPPHPNPLPAGERERAAVVVENGATETRDEQSTRCLEALVAVELDLRIATAGGLDAWITQDMLSLGEARRLSLARAWLSDAPVILLDEPTEHIGHDQARRIMARLRRHLHGRIVICTAHDRGVLPDAADVGLE